MAALPRRAMSDIQRATAPSSPSADASAAARRTPAPPNDPYFLAYALANAAQGGASLLTPLFIALVLGGGQREVGLTISLSSVAGVVAGLVWGRLSDRLGRRKPFVLVGFGGVAAGLTAIAGVHSLGALLLAQVALTFLWMAAAAVIPPLAIEGVPRPLWERRLGALNRFGALGWMGGLLLGALWMRGLVEPAQGTDEVALRGLYLLLGALAAVAALLAALWIHEPPQRVDRRFKGLLPAVALAWERLRFAPIALLHLLPTPRTLWSWLRGRTAFGVPLTRFFQSVVVYHVGFSAFWVTMPLYLKDALRLDPSLIFALFVLHQGTSALMNPYVARLAERYRTRYLHRAFLVLRAALTLVAAALPLLQGPARLGTLVAFFTLTGVSWAVINVSATAIISKRVRTGRRGQAIGTYQAAIGIGSILGALLGGLLADRSYPANFAFATLCIVAGLLMTRRLPPRLRPEARERERDRAHAPPPPSRA